MLVKELFTKLNCLAKYALEVASLDHDKLKVFFGKLRLDITKDVMIGDNPPKSLSEVLGRILRLKAIR